jgi:hypothetical protein
MSEFERGMRKLFVVVITNLIVSGVVNVLITSPDPLISQCGFLFAIVNTIGTIGLVLGMPYWGTVYLLGWMFGMYLLVQSGSIENFYLVIYLGIPLTVLIYRGVKLWLEQEF